MTIRIRCRACSGTGRTPHGTCRHCFGRGVRLAQVHKSSEAECKLRGPQGLRVGKRAGRPTKVVWKEE